MSELSEILNLINPDPSVLKKGRERQAADYCNSGDTILNYFGSSPNVVA